MTCTRLFFVAMSFQFSACPLEWSAIQYSLKEPLLHRAQHMEDRYLHLGKDEASVRLQWLWKLSLRKRRKARISKNMVRLYRGLTTFLICFNLRWSNLFWWVACFVQHANSAPQIVSNINIYLWCWGSSHQYVCMLMCRHSLVIHAGTSAQLEPVPEANELEDEERDAFPDNPPRKRTRAAPRSVPDHWLQLFLFTRHLYS